MQYRAKADVAAISPKKVKRERHRLPKNVLVCYQPPRNGRNEWVWIEEAVLILYLWGVSRCSTVQISGAMIVAMVVKLR